MNVLDVRNVTKSFFGKPVLDGVSFSVSEGDAISLAGANGAGKTTLLKILSGIASKDSGEIHCTFPTRLYLGHAPGIYAGLSPVENLRLILNLYAQELDESALERSLSDIGLEQHRNRPSRVLSQGLLQRLKFAIASLLQWDILLFDEPYAALDEEGQSLAESFFKSWTESRKTVICVDHHSERALAMASRQLVLENGQLQEAEQS
jgi:heme exporter protein A